MSQIGAGEEVFTDASSNALVNETRNLEAALAKLKGAAFAIGVDSNDDMADNILDQMAEIGQMLVKCRASSMVQIVGKIKIWRALADEDSLNYETASVDEALILSIIEDVERLAA